MVKVQFSRRKNLKFYLIGVYLKIMEVLLDATGYHMQKIIK